MVRARWRWAEAAATVAAGDYVFDFRQGRLTRLR
jgi:hypothetical protein